VELINTALSVTSTVAALLTVWLAFLALGKAKETVLEAKTARLEAEQAAKEAAADRRTEAAERHDAAREEAADRRQAAADRREAERDRRRRRLERVGELVEDLFWMAETGRQGFIVPADKWMARRNLLGHAIVGLHDQLPETASLLDCANVGQAFGPASRARLEIERVLAALSRDQDSDHQD